MTPLRQANMQYTHRIEINHVQINFQLELHAYVVVVNECSISNVIVTGDIEALLYSKIHAVLEC